MYVFSGKDVFVEVQLSDFPVRQGEIFPPNLPFLPLIYLENVSINVAKGVDIVWIVGRRNIGGVVPVSLPPATVNLNFPFIHDNQLYLFLTSFQRRPHKKFVHMRVVFSPDVFGREFVLEFQNGMTREMSVNLPADRWGTVSLSILFPFTILRFTHNLFTKPPSIYPFIPKGYQTTLQLYPENSSRPLDWVSSGTVNSLRFTIHTDVNFDYTFPSLWSFFPKPNPYIPYNAPSSISEGRYYIDGNIVALLPGTWTLQGGELQGGITGTMVDKWTMVLTMLDDNQQERIVWYLYDWTPKNINFSVSPNEGVRFSSDFIALNFDVEIP